MSIAGLAELVLSNPVLEKSMVDARSGLATLDLTGPAALRPFVVKGLVDAGRTVLVVAATVREAEDLTEELGDLLFAVVNVARHLRIEPEAALRSAAHKFRGRFEAVEALARDRGIDLHASDLTVLDALWDEIKRTA